MLALERRNRLLSAMSDAGIDEMLLYGNGWQGDYLRYATDFGILEGHGIAVVSGRSVELFLDSATDAERAEAETSGVEVRLAPDIVRAVGARLAGKRRRAAAPLRFVPNGLTDKARGLALADGTKLLDGLLM